MRRTAVSLSLALLTASCGRGSQPPPGPIPVEQAATVGADTLAIERTVAAFLQGYATADVSTELLREQVAGPDMEDWVRWLEVQYRGVEDQISADLDVRGIRAVHIEAGAAAAGVAAAVTISAPGKDGAVVPNVRVFQTPMILARGPGPHEWRVVDANRDGRSMRDAITVLSDVGTTTRGLTVQVASVYRFSSGTVVNVEITNGTGEPVTVDGPHSVLQVGGRFLGAQQITTSLADPIQPKKTREGALNFPPIPLTSVPQLLRLFVLEQDGEPAAVVELPLEAFPPREP